MSIVFLLTFVVDLHASCPFVRTTHARRFAFPAPGATLVSLEALQVNGSLALYAIFKSGEVVSIDPQTGATHTVANLVSTEDGATVTGALTVDTETATMCVVVAASLPRHHQSTVTHREQQ